MKFLFVSMLAVGALVLAVSLPSGGGVQATNPPPTAVAPLIGCPNVDGSKEPPQQPDPNKLGGVRVDDIVKVVEAYFHDAPAGFPNAIDSDYVLLYDRDANGLLRVGDIVNVVEAYFTDCPKVDTQIAQATQWILSHPGLITEANDTGDDLDELGYVGGSTDVPGQGKHYVKLANWDGVFDPAAPEGLVYHDGLIAAQLYVINGDAVDWVEDPYSSTPGPCSDGINNNSTSPHGDALTDGADPDCTQSDPGNDPKDTMPPPTAYPALDDVNIDPLCDPAVVQPTGACSWATSEGWHLHYRLCTIHIGSPNAAAVPMPVGSTAASCQALHNGTGGGAGDGTWTFNYKVGWMGHLWNWIPNANQVPDSAGMNGRFADCFPDPSGSKTWWGPYNCPQ